MRVTAIFNNKGGVGKTAVAYNLCYELALADKRTLLVDLDEQRNGSDVYVSDDAPNISEALLNARYDLTKLIVPATSPEGEEYKNLFIVPGSHYLATLVPQLSVSLHKEKRLANLLKPLKNQFDHVIIDCPPSLGTLGEIAAFASDDFIIPVEGGSDAINGIAFLLKKIEEVKETDDINYMVVQSMVDGRQRRLNKVNDQELEVIRERVAKTTISATVYMKDSKREQLPIAKYMPHSKCAKQFKSLSKEVLNASF